MGRTTIRGTRPEHYFGRRKTMRPNAAFIVEMPAPLVEAYGDEGTKRVLTEALEAKVAQALREVRTKGWRSVGANRAANVSPLEQAVPFEVFGSQNPDLSTYGLPREEEARVKRAYIAFHLAYHECRQRTLRGDPDVRWPPGTWAMVRHFGQRSSPLPTPL